MTLSLCEQPDCRPLLGAVMAGVESCRGDRLVAGFFSAQQGEWLQQPWYLVAVGKAAGAMAAGALAVGSSQLVRGLVVGKRDGRCWLDDARVRQLAAGHPLPDEDSLLAGAALVDFFRALPCDARVLFLLSGGASALVEVLPAGMSLQDWQQMTQGWLVQGWDIQRINAQRKQASGIKGGKLLQHLPAQARVLQLVISDVVGNDLASIGSGLLSGVQPDARVESHLLADNAALRASVLCGLPAAWALATAEAFWTQSLSELVAEISRQARPGAVGLWGGEPTLCLPEQSGRGGRAQQLALSVLWTLREAAFPWVFLALGSDGTDGPTSDAGACVHWQLVSELERLALDVPAVLAACDAGSVLAQLGALVSCGETGTNVNDVMLLWCGGEA